MRYITTNIRLPEKLWKGLKLEAAERGRRMSEIIRERLSAPVKVKTPQHRKIKSLRGLWKGLEVSDSIIEEAKKSLFPPIEKFISQ